MNNIIKYSIIALMCFVLSACDDMNSVHRKYLDMPETNYIGIPKDVVAFSGLERVVFNWSLNADPKISTFIVEWTDIDGQHHSESTPVVRNETNTMAFSIPLAEGTYNFTVYHTSDKGDLSLETAVSARSFGSNYINTLINRSYALTATLSGALFTWDTVDGVIATELEYEAADGTIKSLTIAGDESRTLLPDFKIGGTFSLRTSYLPDGSIDEVSCNKESYKFPSYIEGDKSKYLGKFKLTAKIIPDWSQPFVTGEERSWEIEIAETNVAGFQFEVTGLLDPETKAAIGAADFKVYWKWRYLEGTPQDYIQSPQQSTGVDCTFNGVDGKLYMTHKRTDNAAGGYGNGGWHFNYDLGTVFFGHFNNNGQNVLRFCMNDSVGTPIVDYYLPVLTKIE